MTDIVILGGARTAIGTFGGSLAGVSPIDLGAIAAKAALTRAEVAAEQIGHVAFGHVINTEPRDMYLSRVAAMEAGISDQTPAMNVNRLCGSGLQAIVSVAQSLMLGDADFGLAGGAENMSRAPYIMQAQRWGQKMGDVKTLDMMLGALHCPFGTGHMGNHRRKCCTRTCHHPRRSRCLCFGKPEPRRSGDCRRALCRPNHPRADQSQTRYGGFHHR